MVRRITSACGWVRGSDMPYALLLRVSTATSLDITPSRAGHRQCRMCSGIDLV